MKYWLSVLLIITAPCIRAQDVELQGIYRASFIGAESINFVGKDSFYFGGFYCTYGVAGKGRCEVRNGYLYLYFENSKTVPFKDTIPPPVIVGTPSTASANTILVKVVDKNENPMPYVSIVSGRTGTMTNNSGEGHLKISGKTSPFILQISSVELETESIELKPGTDYTVKVYGRVRRPDEKLINNGEVYVYEIDELTEDHILMRPEHSGGPFRNYRKRID